MITESELRDTLARQAESYEVPPYDLISLRAAAERRRSVGSRLRYGGMAAAVLLAVAVVWGLLRSGLGDIQPADKPSDVTISPSCVPPGETPPVPDSMYAGDGFLSDEPVTATSPEPGDPSCTLVLRYWAHRFGAGGHQQAPLTSYMVWLFSDGRLIVDTDEDLFVQWQRRLTPAGVERVRQMMATRLGEPVAEPSDKGEAAIYFGDGIFYPEDSEALRDRLQDWSWLPDRYWVQETPSIYRAAWYLTCYAKPTSPADDVLAAVRELPAGARDVLESREWTTVPPDTDGLYPGDPDPAACQVIDRADANMLAKSLGGNITDGKADVFGWGKPAAPRGFFVSALMPDGTPGAHGD
jgi:hypothetical protein